MIYKFKETKSKNENEILDLLNELNNSINGNKVEESIKLITSFLEINNFKSSIIDPTI